MSKEKITIIGTGFAALTAVRELRKRSRDVDICVISPRAEFVFLPSLIWIPSGIRKPQDLVIPLHNFFARQRVDFVEAEVTGMKDGGRTVLTDKGEISNDAVVIASGGRFIKKLPGIEHVITPCGGGDS